MRHHFQLVVETLNRNLEARLTRETTGTLRWIAARFQADSWKKPRPHSQSLAETHDLAENVSKLEFDPWITPGCALA